MLLIKFKKNQLSLLIFIKKNKLMKLLFSIIVLLSLLILLSQVLIIRSTNKTEKRKFRLILKQENFEIRYYSDAIIATTYIEGNTYQKVASPGFKKLAKYIFGANQSNQNISMTSPVEMSINDSLSQMSFTMPSNQNIESLPKPDDSKIKIHSTPAEYLAVLTFGGYSSDQKIKHYTSELKNLLDQKRIKHSNNFRYLGYNPPYQLIGRHNEIAVSIQYNESNQKN